MAPDTTLRGNHRDLCRGPPPTHVTQPSKRGAADRHKRAHSARHARYSTFKTELDTRAHTRAHRAHVTHAIGMAIGISWKRSRTGGFLRYEIWLASGSHILMTTTALVSLSVAVSGNSYKLPSRALLMLSFNLPPRHSIARWPEGIATNTVAPEREPRCRLHCRMKHG